ncbi:MAG: hypothetical protein EOO65_01630 [Methanosarcinales archaeon]|nr:MAG: hypothetical protein EOO65_01630 [Methanosarcinales archaeon]
MASGGSQPPVGAGDEGSGVATKQRRPPVAPTPSAVLAPPAASGKQQVALALSTVKNIIMSASAFKVCLYLCL